MSITPSGQYLIRPRPLVRTRVPRNTPIGMTACRQGSGPETVPVRPLVPDLLHAAWSALAIFHALGRYQRPIPWCRSWGMWLQAARCDCRGACPIYFIWK